MSCANILRALCRRKSNINKCNVKPYALMHICCYIIYMCVYL